MALPVVCRCLFQYCCDSQSIDTADGDDVDDYNDDHRNDRPQPQPQSYSSVSDYVHPIEGQGLISSRGERRQSNRHNVEAGAVGDSTTTLASTSTTTADDNEDDATTPTTCCRPSAATTTISDLNEPSFYDTIRLRMNLWNSNYYNAVVTPNDTSYRHHFSSTATMKDGKILMAPSPLRQAISFNAMNDSNTVCTINADEIVLPGSMIQQKMAEQMILTSGGNILQSCTIDECVICMEPFDSSNPRMPTLCYCGANKTYFHLPCLYQWIEQSEDCPSCRTKITWEEF